MAKQGMARPERTHVQPHNTVSPVPELHGKAKSGKRAAQPLIAGNHATGKVYHEMGPDGPIQSGGTI